MKDSAIRDRQERFYKWLSEKVSPAQLSELYMAASDLTEYGKSKRLFQVDFFELEDVPSIIRLRKRLEGDRIYKFTHFGKSHKMLAFLRYYIDFLNGQKSEDLVRQEVSPDSAVSVPEEKTDDPKAYREDSSLTPGEPEISQPLTAQLQVDFDQDSSYLFTKPISYTYKGTSYPAKSWNGIYVEICGLLFADHREAFMRIMNGDIPGYNSLAFADEAHKSGMHAARCFAPGYYLETKLSATDIVRRIRGLYRLFDLGGNLRISYTKTGDEKPSVVADDSGEEWIIRELRQKKIPFTDNRSLDGCLWIASDMNIPISLKEAAERGYRLRLKQDGCRAYPNRPVLWTKDQPKKPINTVDFRRKLDESFKPYLLTVKKLAPPTAAQYSQSIEAVERFILERELGCTLDTADPDEAQRIYDMLLGRKDFVDWNNQRHHQYGAALAQYIGYLRQDENGTEDVDSGNHMTIKDAAAKVLREAGEPLTAPQILERIETSHSYQFNSKQPLLILYQTLIRFCRGTKISNHAPIDAFEKFTDEAGRVRYRLIDESPKREGGSEALESGPADERWLPILQDSFPDGYILNDFLGQFQAAAFWQERYGEECPIQGEAIDAAMKAVGAVRDGRVYPKSEEDVQLLTSICNTIMEILSEYSAVYRSQIYERYRDALSAISIYSEPVMTEQLMRIAKDRFYQTGPLFSRRGNPPSVQQDCRLVLRKHGAMNVKDVANVLWFDPPDVVYHCLTGDGEAVNMGFGNWMLAEQFPVTREDAEKIGDKLDEYFLTRDFLQSGEIYPFLQRYVPSIAENLAGLSYQAVFNIVSYYLDGRFGITKAVIAPKGKTLTISGLFQGFAAERASFTLGDLEEFASQFQLPIYWSDVYAHAVRVSYDDFISRSRIQFDIEATDRVLEAICPGDYMPFEAVSSAMMMHLPPCGYQWNGYLLLNYVYAFSKVFRLCEKSLGKAGYYGAMVRRSCKEINVYDTLAERVLTDDDTWSTPKDALSLLVHRGYQAQQRLKGIDAIVARARQKKQEKQDGR